MARTGPDAAAMHAQIVALTRAARRLVAGCRVRANDGTVLYTPDGRGNYRALWTRDFAYLVENAGDMLPLEDTEAALRYLLKGQRADGAVPDRMRVDGVPVYVAGPEDHPLGEPNLDNPPFLVIAVDAYLRQLPDAAARARFAEWAAPLERGMDWVPRDASGLVYNDPQMPHSPYGFTDTVGKTGALFFESLLYWDACRRIAGRQDRNARTDRAREYERRARRIEKGIGALWDDTTGAFLAATGDCRQIDIWGNAWALWLGFPLGRRRARILRFLAENYDRYVWHGQVRHLLRGEYWQRQLTPVAPERYQNGAYWATASGWVMGALVETAPDRARQMFLDLVADFQAGGVCECVNDGYRQLESYVVSAANPLAAARRLFHQGRGNTVGTGSGSAMGETTVVISRGRLSGTYQAFPDLCRLQSGEIVCVFYAGYGHVSLPTPEWPRGGRICLTRSGDEGRTWSEPAVLFDDWDDNRDPHIAQLSDGTLICSFFSLRPRGAAWEIVGVQIVRSRDNGRSWEQTATILVPGWACSAPVRELPGGVCVLGVYTEPGRAAWGGVVRSLDRGRTWGAPNPIGREADLPLDAETDVVLRKDGTLYAALRSSRVNMHYATSADRGATWSAVRDIGFAAHCPHFTRLRTGEILLAHRLPQTALHVSRDEGRSWQGPFILDDVIGAYPSTVELKDGTVLAVYYTEGADSVVRARRFRLTGGGIEILPLL